MQKTIESYNSLYRTSVKLSSTQMYFTKLILNEKGFISAEGVKQKLIKI